MHDRKTLKQPILGIFATLLCILVSLSICALFDAETFGTWVTLLLVGMVPAQIVLGLVWGSRFPLLSQLNDLSQPYKGLSLLAVMIVAGLIVAPLAIALVGGGITPPLPYAVMYIIFSVVVAFWLVIVMQCWPLTVVCKSESAIGLGVWGLTYLIAYGLFQWLFNFGFLDATPLYIPGLDPQGLFPAWNALSFSLTTLVVMLALVLLDFSLLQPLIKRVEFLGRQPMFGLLTTLLILVVSYGLWHWCVITLAMDPVVYMARVPASIIFGQFIMLIMLQTSPVQTLVQPLKGIVLLACALLLSVLMYGFYTWVSALVVGPLASGAPTYQMDLWLASAMLAVTFPVLVLYADFMEFWLLAKPAASDTQAEEGAGDRVA